MDKTETGRAPPLIIRVPPPVRPEYTNVDFAVVYGIIAVAVVGCLALVARPLNWPAAVVLSLFAIPFFTFWLASENRRHRKFRQSFESKAEPFDLCPVARALLAEWKRPSSPPSPDRVRAVVHEAFPPNEPRATLVWFGIAGKPRVGYYQFEPEIVSPAHRLRSHMYYIWTGLALLTIWALGFLPGFPFRVNLSCLYGALGPALIAATIWAWRTGVRATYVRIAPRMIQFLRYAGTKRKPAIRSYPIEAGTLVVLAHTANKMTLTLACEEAEDRVELSKLPNSRVFIDKVWQALLSTAPTPPLSDEELVG